MKLLQGLFLVVLASSGWAAQAAAGISPYVRVAYGANRLEMSEVNGLIGETETEFRSAGLPVELDRVGPASGIEGSAGLWLFPAFRVGATYGYQKSILEHRVHDGYGFFFGHDAEFRMQEVGGEALVRIARAGGLNLGGQVVRSRAELVEGLTIQDGSNYYLDSRAEGTKVTYAAFIGFDQTNPAGIAGSLRIGYRFRDMGQLPSRSTISDGSTSTSITGQSVAMDYSGFYLTLGVGFDLAR